MRVIAGKAKGHSLKTLEGKDVRPTLDRVKESVFSILYPYLENAKVLDLFAGSGALGIEAISRGASVCHFVDVSKKSYDCVIENLRHTKLEDCAVMHLKSAESFLSTNSESFDIIFLDPPYSKGFEDSIFPYLKDCLSDDGVILLETEESPREYDGFESVRRARYGRVFVTVYKKGDSK
ncbi:MAG: 16S rRNA (guanine(966)-N(2))-methyltransferase RsmD [Clostridia bacterium]|nr:16S rRNA (guanine(966)-N(2))-methyltransferase RsmD [Clostridia bacterium]